ncbi:MAG: hypothetical protein ABI083_17995 [Lapillicoccus sp.]
MRTASSIEPCASSRRLERAQPDGEDLLAVVSREVDGDDDEEAHRPDVLEVQLGDPP